MSHGLHISTDGFQDDSGKFVSRLDPDDRIDVMYEDKLLGALTGADLNRILDEWQVQMVKLERG